LLATALKKPFGAAIASVLKALAIDAQAKNEAVSEKISLPAEHERGGQWLDATLVPQENGETLILCRNITIDVNVRSALVESRQRYKDLVEIACDFAWETDSAGYFTFISKDQVLGYTSQELIGVNPEKLLAQSAVSTTLPFHPEDTISNEELWLNHADGHPLCIMVAWLPLFDGLGRRTGTRGICTDISVQRLRDDILSRSRIRDRVVTYIVDSFRSKERPQEMLKSAASSIGRALETQGCDIFIRTSDGELSHAASFGITASEQEWSQRVLDQIEDDSHFEGRQSNFSVLAATTEVNQRGNGAIVLLRESAGAAWTEEDRVLLTALREPLGMALAHIAEQQKLEELSRIDELTGLLNRRAFNDDLRARLSRSVRRARAGALIYVDLDNFKPVNDTHGHDKGDEVLRVLAKILHNSIREYDLAGRIGGDEFAIWLDDANDVIAMRRGESIVEDCKKLAEFSANEKTPLSVSAGIAVYDPDTQESLEDLVVRADQAMYEAKRNGKGRAAMASHAVLG
jgi:diguanylate cyclase (GGDEF)-like protein/PAS domain S-box-containing protein